MVGMSFCGSASDDKIFHHDMFSFIQKDKDQKDTQLNFLMEGCIA